jgi:hypothetical protein
MFDGVNLLGGGVNVEALWGRATCFSRWYWDMGVG